MFRHVNAVVLFARDFQASLVFYRDTLGLPVALLEDDFVAFKLHDQDFALQALATAVELFDAQVEPAGAQSDRVMLCADVDDVNAVYDTLTARGLDFVKAPFDRDWGYRTAYFRDPDGNLWELRQSIKARPPSK